MKKTFLFIATLLFISYSNAQEPVENYYNLAKGNAKEVGEMDKNGFPIGEWKYYLEDGTLDYSINWDTNFSTKYYSTSELKEKGTFIPDTGVHIGEWITYNRNGEIKAKINYDKNGNLIKGPQTKKE
jgi:antitoxin component YwqK of YwqJK toxin-antitoxin module